MKIPALRAKMGDWVYYVTTLTFGQVVKFVSRVDSELHQSESLKDLIQRSITNNYKSIKEYILNQPEMFFNALVLAVYDDYPNWREIEFTYDDQETYQMGLLEFPGNHKIFPVDGQHRVEGIKAALREDPKLANETITCIFIGHSNDSSGMQRTRRLFSTLNRYAKPVTMDDIIALDEDDSIAIVTRELLEQLDLFTKKRVTKSKNKAIPESDKQSFTSIITLYQCNRELLKVFRLQRKKESPDPIRDNKKFAEYLKFRPSDIELELFSKYCFRFWTSFRENLDFISTFLNTEGDRPALQFRNRETGGNLLFRPVGLLPMIQATIEIHKRKQIGFDQIFDRFNRIDFTISLVPWRTVVWNPNEKTMIMGTSGLIKLLLLFMFGQNVIRPHEKKRLIEKYADKINAEASGVVLSKIPILD